MEHSFDIDYYMKHLIYDEPFGTDSMVYEYWHIPAHSIGLKLISIIYNNGLLIETFAEYMELREEIQKLLDYWDSKIFNFIKIDTKETLLCSAQYLKQAIESGIKTNGKLNIS
jgi:hypothetical protein